TPSQLLLVQCEDVEGAIEAVNMPGTTDQYPNWRRRLKLPLERWPQLKRFTRLTKALAKERGDASRPWRKEPTRQTVIPRATYRLQFNREFTLALATELVPYFAALGVSHICASPLLRARPESLHGYDITDHNQLNPEIGSREDFERLVAALKSHGMGLVLDIVPNHMGVMGADNAWWLDLLENGKASSFAAFFDIDWDPVNVALSGRLIVPVLGAHYGQVLRQGELKLAFDRAAGSFSVFYFEHRFPIDPREYAGILRRALRNAPVGLDSARAAEFEALASSFSHLPLRNDTAPEKMLERNRDKTVHKAQLARLAQDPTILTMLEDAVRELNGKPGDNASFDALHQLLEAQAYRVSYWRVASDEINYRRFFDINELAGLRMEDEAVFEATHGLILELLAQGKVDALRIDHPDGLYDPVQYFRRLQDRFAAVSGQAPGGRPLYVAIEKIVAGYERVPESWAVHGATGYRFANVVNGLFVDAAAEARIDRIYRGFIGAKPDYTDIVYRAKRTIMRSALASELNVLANRLWRIAQASRDTRDFTVNSLRQALEEVIASFPVYRTYIVDQPSDEDRRFIEWAIAQAKNRNRAADVTVFDFVREVLLINAAEGRAPEFQSVLHAFVGKFQQLTGPVTAKGLEDTTFYIY
ncbi:MAG: malto-oligosyltrehalose synthase, partial [Burkholderiales bacterium]